MGTKSTPFDWSSFKPTAKPRRHHARPTCIPEPLRATPPSRSRPRGPPPVEGRRRRRRRTTSRRARHVARGRRTHIMRPASARRGDRALRGGSRTPAARSTIRATRSTSTPLRPGQTAAASTMLSTTSTSNACSTTTCRRSTSSTRRQEAGHYGLGRSGNLVSSAANDLTADLATQNDVNIAGIRNQADTAAGDLRFRSTPKTEGVFPTLRDRRPGSRSASSRSLRCATFRCRNRT